MRAYDVIRDRSVVTINRAFLRVPLAILLCLSGCIMGQPKNAEQLDWKKVRQWFSDDTQTIIVAPRSFTIPKTDSNETRDSSPIAVLRSLALGGLAEFPAIYGPLVEKTVSFAVAGVSAFHGFSGVGLGPYDGCAVVSFTQPLGTTLNAALVRAQSMSEVGATAFVLSKVREGSLRSQPEYVHLYVSQIDPNTIVVATDRDSLHALLQRRRYGGAPSPPLSERPEWEQADPTTPVFALRHFLHSNGHAIGSDDADAIGMVYNGQGPGPTQTAYYLSGNRRAVEMARRLWQWKDEGLTSPRVNVGSGGVVQVVVPTRSPDATGTFTLLLLRRLGFAMAI